MSTPSPSSQLPLLPDEPLTITFGEVEVAALDHEEVPIEASAALIASVKRLGVLEPLIVRSSGPDKPLRLIAGRRRLDAARKAGLATIPVGVATVDDATADVVTISENALRRANAITEFRAVERLVARGASERDICAATGMARGTIRKRLELLRLGPTLIDAFAAGRMAPSVAEAAAKLPAPLQAKLVDRVVASGRITAKDVHEVRTVRRKEATALLPDALFDFDEIELPHGERPGEPVEAALARELQSVVERLPRHPSVQGVVRRSIEYAAERLMDLATGSYEPPASIFGIPVEIDPTMPPDTMKFVGADGQEITVTNVGMPQEQEEQWEQSIG